MPLSGKEMLALYLRNGWYKISQKGSHVKVGKGNLREIIPMHQELKRGTESALLKRLEENK
ncbi:MAG TPA: type II toxin-antitoxin system HicA family toxin [Spirochaetota bacterium]|nr:type II toxin-antitoxin system HicA family toxin [Spirochaetota bacterium]